MDKPVIYIDGQEGTTGLQIQDRLSQRQDITLLRIDPEKRHDVAARRELMNQADIVFLCLPDAAAVEAVSLVENRNTRIIDASTAHRTDNGWTYGFPELSPEQRERIKNSFRTANPGCHATGFISGVYPLVKSGVLPKDYPLACYSLTGYSGGGKKMIAQYEAQNKTSDLFAPRIYGLNLAHKHLPEMTKICGLTRPPVFCPIVDDYEKGMATTISLHNDLLARKQLSAENIRDILAEYYQDQKLIQVAPFGWSESMIAANTLSGRDVLTLIVNGNQNQTIVTALFDNLGKGASGAAVQNMNLMLGFSETTGLSL